MEIFIPLMSFCYYTILLYSGTMTDELYDFSMGGGKDLFCGGHVEYRIDSYICILCIILLADKIFSSTTIKDFTR